LDAMTHAIEALTSATSQPICDGMALQAIRMIKENLPRAIANGRDEEARSQLQLAATMAGWAFTGAHVGLVHSNGTYAGDDVRCSPRCRLRYHPS
jgi:alcohol dehydrogenase class IV